MMSGMKGYYLSRALTAAGVCGFLVLAGSSLRIGISIGTLVMIWFLLAPRLGRYAVQPKQGLTALRRDERGEAISRAAARNAFVACMLAVAAVVIYARASAAEAVAIGALEAILLLGALIYCASDFWLRRLNE